MEGQLFPDALRPPPFPSEVRGDAGLSACGQYRWWLRRWWRAGPHACWIMLNPSTADDKTDDPTMRRVIQFTRTWGYSGCTVVNLYPFRTSSPAACRKWADWSNNGPDWYARDRLNDNRNVVADHARRADLVVAAWGAGAWDDEWTDSVIEEIGCEEPFPVLHCIGRTLGGAPKHPLARGVHRVPDDQKPVPWLPHPDSTIDEFA